MWKTVIFLLATLVTIPVLAYLYDIPPTEKQISIIWNVTIVYLVLAFLCFVVSTATNNFSQVDKLWSIAPIPYAWQIAYLGEWNERLVLMAILVTIWGARLTYNFARRGAYQWKFWLGEEDYRWSILRAKPEFQAPWKWFLFNLLFISFYQMGLVMLIVFPMIKAIDGGSLTWIDYLLAGILVALVAMEFFADQQQYDFQTEKYRRINAGEPLGEYEHGFTNLGLWKYMRHPNYTAEQSIWVVFYLFSIVATGSFVNWSIAGAILLILLFFGSSNFSEEISAAKYPKYKEYQKKVARFIPFVRF